MQDKAKSAGSAGEDRSIERAVLTHVVATHPTTLALSDLIREMADPGDFSEATGSNGRCGNWSGAGCCSALTGRCCPPQDGALPLGTGIELTTTLAGVERQLQRTLLALLLYEFPRKLKREGLERLQLRRAGGRADRRTARSGLVWCEGDYVMPTLHARHMDWLHLI